MPKSILHISINTNLLELAKANNIKLSNLMEETLKTMLEEPQTEEIIEESSLNSEILAVTNNLNALKLKKQINDKNKALMQEEINKKDYERRKKISDETSVPIEMIK